MTLEEKRGLAALRKLISAKEAEKTKEIKKMTPAEASRLCWELGRESDNLFSEFDRANPPEDSFESERFLDRLDSLHRLMRRCRERVESLS